MSNIENESINLEKYFDKKGFKIPIEYLKNKKKISNILKTDLELTKNNDENNKNLTTYEKIFVPESNLGRQCLDVWSRYFTTDKKFLIDSQKLYKNANILPFNKNLIENMQKTWFNFKNQNNFYEKYQYIDWSRFLWLNKSVLFLTIMSFYNLSSPVLNLVAPVFILLVPFLILKIMKLPITWDTYYTLLMKNLKHHAIGKLLVTFNDVSIGQKVYIIFCIGLYFYNIYQNIIMCYRFYNNTYTVINNFEITNEYLDYTIQKIKILLSLTQKYKSYNLFNQQLKKKIQSLQNYKNTIKNIPKSNGLQKFINIGKLMKEFYVSYENDNIETLMNWSFGFHGYIDNILGINKNIVEKNINKCSYTKKIKFKVKNIWHPCVDNPIKNNIDLNKSFIITGPNAAGKTTIIKSCIINLLLNQQIGFGCYDTCKMSIFDFIHCYLNIPDTCSRDSLFQAEARRCKTILNEISKFKDKKHFCIFDELYSGTNPYEAISGAYSYLKFIGNNKNVKFMLTTHYLKLCDLLKKHQKIQNKSMLTLIENNIPKYFYKIVDGKSDLKGGVSVLKKLEYPPEILKEAQIILKKLE